MSGYVNTIMIALAACGLFAGVVVMSDSQLGTPKSMAKVLAGLEVGNATLEPRKCRPGENADYCFETRPLKHVQLVYKCRHRVEAAQRSLQAGDLASAAAALAEIKQALDALRDLVDVDQALGPGAPERF